MESLPASSSRHFSCSRPFFGMANSNRSFRLSTKSDMVESVPNVDRSLLGIEDDALRGTGGRVMVDADISAGVAGEESRFPMGVEGGRDMSNVVEEGVIRDLDVCSSGASRDVYTFIRLEADKSRSFCRLLSPRRGMSCRSQ